MYVILYIPLTRAFFSVPFFWDRHTAFAMREVFSGLCPKFY